MQTFPQVRELLGESRLDQLTKIRFAATGQDDAADRIAQLQHRPEAGSRWHHRGVDLHTDGTAPRKPLIAAQHRPRPADDARQDGNVGLRRDFERTEIEAGEAGAAGERALREETQNVALTREGDQCFGIQAAGDVVTLNERYSETLQEPGKKLPGQFSLWRQSLARPGEPQ